MVIIKIKLRIGVDLDDVIMPFKFRLIEVYKTIHPDHSIISEDQWSDFHLSSYFPIGDDIYSFFDEKYTEQVYLHSSPVKGSKEFIDELRGISYVIIVTSRPDSLKHITACWLDMHDIVPHSLIFSKNKGMLPIDILLDDGPINLESAKQAGIRAVCWDYSWNKHWKGERVHSFQQFIDVVKNLNSG